MVSSDMVNQNSCLRELDSTVIYLMHLHIIIIIIIIIKKATLLIIFPSSEI